MSAVTMGVARRLFLAAAMATTLQAAARAATPADAAAMRNTFAVSLYGRLAAATADNLFFSPYSVYAALAMTAEGARGQTALEMGRVLGLPAGLQRRGEDAAARPWDFTPVHESLGALARRLDQDRAADPPERIARVDSLRTALAVIDGLLRTRGASRAEDSSREFLRFGLPAIGAELDALVAPLDVRVANSLWCAADRPLAADYVRTIAGYYGADCARNADFTNDPDGARAHINDWVVEHTAGRIHELMPEGSVGRLTRLVLANAITFRAQWSEPFEPARTSPADFHLAGGGRVVAPLMQHFYTHVRYGAYRGDGRWFATPLTIRTGEPADFGNPAFYPGRGGFQVVELPYLKSGLSMVVLLPGSNDGLAAIEARLASANLASWIAQLELREAVVKLPRFRFEQGRELGGALRELGMTSAFTGAARFGGMTGEGQADPGLSVGAVFHRAFVEVNERGTEAAAATAVEMGESSIDAPNAVRPFVPMFVADRPFFFLIRDVPTGSILFMGRVQKP